MKRRQFVRTVGLGVGAGIILKQVPVKAFNIESPEIPTIEQLLPMSYDICKREWLRGRMFRSDVLEQAYRQGKIKVMSLGAYVEVPEYSGKKIYDVQQLSTPLVWTKRDNLKNDEKGRIALTRSLIDNGFESHDFMLEEQLKRCQLLVVSKQYRYDRSPVAELVDRPAFYTMIYTAFCAIPKWA